MSWRAAAGGFMPSRLRWPHQKSPGVGANASGAFGVYDASEGGFIVPSVREDWDRVKEDGRLREIYEQGRITEIVP
jgi:hypothetical protein